MALIRARYGEFAIGRGARGIRYHRAALTPAALEGRTFSGGRG